MLFIHSGNASYSGGTSSAAIPENWLGRLRSKVLPAKTLGKKQQRMLYNRMFSFLMMFCSVVSRLRLVSVGSTF